MPSVPSRPAAAHRTSLRALVGLVFAASVLVCEAGGGQGPAQPQTRPPQTGAGPVPVGVAPNQGATISTQSVTTPLPTGVLFPSPTNAYSNSAFWAAVVAQIKAALAVDPNRAPTLLRLAFHMCECFRRQCILASIQPFSSSSTHWQTGMSGAACNTEVACATSTLQLSHVLVLARGCTLSRSNSRPAPDRCGTFDAAANTGGCGHSADSIWNTHTRPENANLMQSLGWCVLSKTP